MNFEGFRTNTSKSEVKQHRKHIGTSFRDTFADLFGKFLKKVNLQIEASFRPARALLEMFLICDVRARKKSAGIGSTGQSLEWPITTLRASLPCRV